MLLLRLPMTNLKMTVSADGAVSVCSPLLLCITALAPLVAIRGCGESPTFWTDVCHPSPTPLTLDKQGVRAFIDRVGRWWGKVPWGNSTVISNSHLQLVTSGLTSIILVVLGSVNLWFQGALIPISLHSVLGIAAAQVLGTVWLS